MKFIYDRCMLGGKQMAIECPNGTNYFILEEKIYSIINELNKIGFSEQSRENFIFAMKELLDAKRSANDKNDVDIFIMEPKD